MFEGLSVAMVTPFQDGAVDREGVVRVVRRLTDGGVDGIVALGSTGEAATLAPAEREEVLSLVVAAAKGRAWVVAGTGTNDTAASIQNTRRAKELGADGAMLVVPYYNKPTPEGQLAHFTAVAKAVDLPLVLYNVPGRTGTSMTPATVARASRVPNIVAIKEAAGSTDQVTEILGRCGITVLSGDDSMTVPFMAIGAKGIVSVVGQVAPEDLAAMVRAAGSGDFTKAASLHARLYPLTKAMFLESNPGPVKYALSALGLIRNELRLPLVPVQAGTAAQIDREIAAFGLAARAA
jgi:4-hydroxy-tetrahydrodipicolinate synthase